LFPRDLSNEVLAMLSRVMLAAIPIVLVGSAWLMLPDTSAPAIPINAVIPEGEEPGADKEADGEDPSENNPTAANPASDTAASDNSDDDPASAQEVTVRKKGRAPGHSDRPRLPKNIKRSVISFVPDPNDPDAPEIDVADESGEQLERYLRIQNRSGEALTVWVQYHRRDAFGAWWEWMPTDPTYSDEAVSFEIGPGETTYLELEDKDEDEYLHANKVRLWASSANGKKYMKYAEKDLWLVPEKNSQREHHYYAPAMGTYTYTLK
jgi:hypothetical protein